MDLKELVSQFESLGDNCEFGVVQRYAGAEPLGFFRWNMTPLPALIEVLDAEFANVDPQRIEFFTQPNREYMVRLQPLQFQYHTHRYEGAVDAAQLREQQMKVLGFLKRKAVDDLRSAAKIWVRKGTDSRGLDDVLALHRRLRNYGPNALLWVVPEDDQRRAGLVEMIGPGLMRGYIDRFAPYDEAYDTSPVWFDLCRHALGLHYAGCAYGTRIGKERGWTTNLLRQAHVEKNSGWWSSATLATEQSRGGTIADMYTPVMTHRLLSATGVGGEALCGFSIGESLAENGLYTGSFYARIPSGAAVRNVGVVLRGLPSLTIANADLSRRDIWQRVSVSGRLAAGQSRTAISLFLAGDADAVVQTTCWQLEAGPAPTPFVASRSGSMRGDRRLRQLRPDGSPERDEPTAAKAA